MWYQRYNELDDKWYLRNKKLVDEHAIEIQKKSGENASLTVEYRLLIFELFLRLTFIL